MHEFIRGLELQVVVSPTVWVLGTELRSLEEHQAL